MSKIIVIEGADRCGKFTQTQLLVNHLRSLEKSVTSVEVPIKDSHTYSIIYWMLKNGLAKKLPRLFQTVQYLNRLIFQIFTLPRLERDNDYIVFDRWSLSSIVYGEASGLPRKFGENLYRKLRRPNYTIILLGVAHKHEAEDVYEADVELQNRVKELYFRWSRDNQSESCVVQSDRITEFVFSDIIFALSATGMFSV